jgi:hypothetical protein
MLKTDISGMKGADNHKLWIYNINTSDEEGYILFRNNMKVKLELNSVQS